ncbi:unnamed protein product [Protopolystoma xenopodis]|uniref:Uncharacterized protein n=1 Tax=Protopolystoma xenopodis TaxID=117903 RepID=A0A3S5AW60_9PLAT|nr:unnamed protein product [Protopolystoma xenopodis]
MSTGFSDSPTFRCTLSPVYPSMIKVHEKNIQPCVGGREWEEKVASIEPESRNLLKHGNDSVSPLMLNCPMEKDFHKIDIEHNNSHYSTFNATGMYGVLDIHSSNFKQGLSSKGDILYTAPGQINSAKEKKCDNFVSTTRRKYDLTSTVWKKEHELVSEPALSFQEEEAENSKGERTKDRNMSYDTNFTKDTTRTAYSTRPKGVPLIGENMKEGVKRGNSNF